MKDYSEIMETLPALHRKREDALRDQMFCTAEDYTNKIAAVEAELKAWLVKQNKEAKSC